MLDKNIEVVGRLRSQIGIAKGRGVFYRSWTSCGCERDGLRDVLRIGTRQPTPISEPKIRGIGECVTQRYAGQDFQVRSSRFVREDVRLIVKRMRSQAR